MCHSCQHIHCARLGCVETIHEIEHQIETQALKNEVLRRIDLKTVTPDYSHTIPAHYYHALRDVLREKEQNPEIY